jgi:hypothetical protein
MSRGPSGRIVVELHPEMKSRLYTHLSADGLTFKEWLIRHIARYLAETDDRTPVSSFRDDTHNDQEQSD